MSTQTRREHLQNPQLNFKISFFQDVFTIVEELTGDCPGVGLPEGFIIKEEDYALFKELQKKFSLTKLFITRFSEVKNIVEWVKIKSIIDLYGLFWKKHKHKLFETKLYLERTTKFKNFVERLQKITKCDWNTKELTVFLTIGYKDSGTYDREVNVIRLGIHENKKDYLVYTLYHELIHYHIINDMKISLKEEDEEVLCRAIFNLLFNDDLIAQKHWKEHLSSEEIKKINEKSQQLQLSL